jgi:hypothetical protein
MVEALAGLREKILKKSEVPDPELSYHFSTNIRNPYVLSQLNGSVDYNYTQDVLTQRRRKPSGSIVGRLAQAVSRSGFATAPNFKYGTSAEPCLSTEAVGNNGVIVSLGSVGEVVVSGGAEREPAATDGNGVSLLRRITGLVARIRRLGH